MYSSEASPGAAWRPSSNAVLSQGDRPAGPWSLARKIARVRNTLLVRLICHHHGGDTLAPFDLHQGPRHAVSPHLPAVFISAGDRTDDVVLSGRDLRKPKMSRGVTARGSDIRSHSSVSQQCENGRPATGRRPDLGLLAGQRMEVWLNWTGG